MAAAFQVAYLLAMPAIGLWLATRYRWAQKLGPVAFAYGFGLLLSQWPERVDAVSGGVRDIAIPLAIPLLLFSLDVRAWLAGARDTVIGFALCVLALLICAASAALLFASQLEHSAEIAGILTGMYSGGTPNAAVVHQALGAPATLFVQINAIDFVSGAIYFLFLISLAGPVYGLFLRPCGDVSSTPGQQNHAPADPGGTVLAVVCAVFIVAVSAGLVQQVTGKLHISWIMLGITSLAIVASRWPRLRAVQSSYGLGYYLVNVFCCAIGSQLALEKFDAAILTIAAMHLSILLGTIALHLGLAKLANLDRDTTIITQTAALYGPPFVPPVAGALGNPAMLLSGLSTGLVGYAAGNYLGIGLAWLLADNTLG